MVVHGCYEHRGFFSRCTVRDTLGATIDIVERVVGRKPSEAVLNREYGRVVLAFDQVIHEVSPNQAQGSRDFV